MRKIFMCAFLFALTATQSQALSPTDTMTIGNFSCVMRIMNPNITDDKIYNAYYNLQSRGEDGKWSDFIKTSKSPAETTRALDKVSWTAAAAANITDGAKYNALKLKAKFSK